jgi:outer membrane protein assembly factor BamB
MKKTFRFISMFMMLYLLFSSITFSQDWPQWSGPGRDAKVTGFKAPSAWPAEIKPEWKVAVGFGDASPVLVGNKIYLNTRLEAEEAVLCLDATTGKEIWRNTYPCTAVTGPAGSHPGPRATPTVSNGKVVTFGVSAILSCLDANTGKLLWRKNNPSNLVPQFFTGMSPLVVDNICIAHTGTKDKGEVIALDLSSGNEKWKWAGDGPSYASPALMTFDGKKMIIVQTEKNLIALNLADGKLLWQLATPVLQRFYNSSSPYINGETIYITGQGSGMKAVKIEKSGTAYIPKELWSNATVGAKWNTPVLKDGYLYGFSDQKRLYCLNASTGETVWIDNTPSSDFSTLLDCGQVLLGLPSTGDLIVFKPEPGAYTEVVKYKVASTPVYAFPLVAGNNVYVKDAESLTLYKIK